MNAINRRRAILASVAAMAAPACVGAAPPPPPKLGLGFSLYGMRGLPLNEAVSRCAEIGYDSIELTVNEGWPTDSAKFGTKQREQLRRSLAENDIRLSAVMENLPIFGDARKHQQNLLRLRLAGEVAHAVAKKVPGNGGADTAGKIGAAANPPILETILGGRPTQWPTVKDEMLRRLEDWAKTAEKAKLVVAIKAHVGGAMHLPEHPQQLVEQLDNPWIRAAYDFSHFRLRNVDLAASLKTLAPSSVFVHVKDAAGDASKVQFLLPGQGDIDYPHLLQGLVAHGYRGDVVVEVSGQIHGKPGYDPIQAATDSYAPLAKAMELANIQRNK